MVRESNSRENSPKKSSSSPTTSLVYNCHAVSKAQQAVASRVQAQTAAMKRVELDTEKRTRAIQNAHNFLEAQRRACISARTRLEALTAANYRSRQSVLASKGAIQRVKGEHVPSKTS